MCHDMAYYTVTCTEEGEELFNPKSLRQLCVQKCAADVESAFFVEQGVENVSKTKVPPEFVEEILEECDHSIPDYFPMLLELQRHLKLELKRLNLNYCLQLNDSQLYEIMRTVRPVGLEIHGCPNLTSASLDTINMFGDNLELLNLGDSAPKILDGSLYEFDLQNLRHLALRNLKFKKHEENNNCYLESLTKTFACNLVHLELFNCKGIKSVKFLLNAKNTLKVLHLGSSNHCAYAHYLEFNSLLEFQKLRFLDLSCCEIQVNDEQRINFLEKLVSHFSDLRHLDLSRVRLVVNTATVAVAATTKTDVLTSRAPLDFINLVNYDHCISRDTNLLARLVLQNHHDEVFIALINAIKYYRERNGELSTSMLDTLKTIWNLSTLSRFPWKKAMDMLLEVARPNLDGWNMFREFIWFLKPRKLTRWQHQHIFDLLIKTINCPHATYSSFKTALYILLSNFLERSSILSHDDTIVLVSTLARFGGSKFGKTNPLKLSEADCNYILFELGHFLHLDSNSTDVSIFRMEQELKETLIVLAYEVVKLSSSPNLVTMYAEIYVKLKEL